MATRQDLDNAIGSLNSLSQTLAALAPQIQSTIATAVAILQTPPPPEPDYQEEVGAIQSITTQVNQAIIILQNSEASLTAALPH